MNKCGAAPFFGTSLVGIIGSLPTLEAWYDFSIASTVTPVSGRIADVQDISGNGRHLTQGAPASRPAYEPAGLNGLGCAYYDVDAVLFTTLNFILAPFTYYVVFSLTGAKPTNDLIGCNSTTTSGDVLLMIFNPSSIVARNHYWPAAGPTPHFVDGTTPIGSSQTYIASGGCPGTGNLTVAINGTTEGTTGSGWTTSAITKPFYLGNRTNAPMPVDALRGRIGEALHFSSVLSAEENALVTQYLSEKWGV